MITAEIIRNIEEAQLFITPRSRNRLRDGIKDQNLSQWCTDFNTDLALQALCAQVQGLTNITGNVTIRFRESGECYFWANSE